MLVQVKVSWKSSSFSLLLLDLCEASSLGRVGRRCLSQLCSIHHVVRLTRGICSAGRACRWCPAHHHVCKAENLRKHRDYVRLQATHRRCQDPMPLRCCSVSWIPQLVWQWSCRSRSISGDYWKNLRFRKDTELHRLWCSTLHCLYRWTLTGSSCTV